MIDSPYLDSWIQYIAANNNPGHSVTYVLPNWGVGEYAGLLGIVLVVGIGLFMLALIVFGRLEGNFAEEL